MLITRIATALVGIPLVLILIWIGGAPFAVASALIASVAGWEAIRLLGGPPRSVWSIAAMVGAALLTVAGGLGAIAILGILVFSLLGTQLIFLFGQPGLSARPNDWARCLLAIVYPGLPLALLVAIRTWTPDGDGLLLGAVPLDRGGRWVLMTLTTVWIVDTAAYAVGRLFGRRPLWTRVSPKKTWEGTIAAVAAGGIAGWFWAPLLGRTPLLVTSLGLLIGGAAVIGDLVESALKRAADVKDSSNLVPGHGGVLDRLDSLLLATIVVFLIAVISGLGNLASV